MSELDDLDVGAVLSPDWKPESANPDGWISELDGETMTAPPEWPPRQPAPTTTPVERLSSPRSPWHDL
jgi:hypothetical protein